MADQFGYNQQFTDKPGMWQVDGYASVIDGYGNLAIFVNRVQTTGVLASVQQTAPSSVVTGIVQTANSSGIYHINLAQTWPELDMCHVETVIPTGLTPAHCIAQINSFTVANTGFGPGQTQPQAVKFTIIDLSTLAAGVLPLGANVFFHLRLQNVTT